MIRASGMPLINYLPDRAAYRLAQLGRRTKGLSWEELLRAGLRGSSVRELQRLLPADALLLEPDGGRIRQWLHHSSEARASYAKRVAAAGSMALKAVTGFEIVPYVAAAFKKTA